MSAVTPLSRIATGRDGSLFSDDTTIWSDRVLDAVRGRRVLCIGGAGSIGSNTVNEIVAFGPEAIHVVDQNENSLVEVVRALRSSGRAGSIGSLRTWPLDYGSPVMRRLLESERAYDLILNFAALKHVRSEKDVHSTLQMLDTNILKQARFLRWLDELGFRGRYFAVSTDKAANPTSMMGATKRVMEHVMFSPETAPVGAAAVTSARFANVAFSDGSLLQGFEQRLARAEPLTAPGQTRRYFVSLPESGQLCLLAAAVAPPGHIVIPRLAPEDHLVSLEDVAIRFLAHHGFEAAHYDDEAEAVTAVSRERAAGRWPLVLTPLDTSGEKPYEEFVGEGEKTVELGLPNVLAIGYEPSTVGIGGLVRGIEDLIYRRSSTDPIDKDQIKALIGLVEPRFLRTHRETGRSLDDRA